MPTVVRPSVSGFTNPSNTCGMIDVNPESSDIECKGIAVGTDENGVRVCEECAIKMEREGFTVARDVKN